MIINILKWIWNEISYVPFSYDANLQPDKDPCPICTEIKKKAVEILFKERRLQIGGRGMNCLECSQEIEVVDTTFSMTGSTKDKHTGDIYYCISCDTYFLDNLLTGNIEVWTY